MGKGTVFKIYLPRLTMSEISKNDHPLEETFRGGDETILLVEDELALRKIAEKILTRLGYTVLQAASGVSAMEVWSQRQNQIALVLTDLVMPEGMSGRDLAVKLRAE